MDFFIPDFRVRRNFTDRCDGDLKPCRNDHSNVLSKINIDPAVASGPLITTINDLVAVITYYGLSGLVSVLGWNLLRNLLRFPYIH